MSTDSKQWRIFRCPSCESLLKLPKDSQARALKCPKCQKTVKIPAVPKGTTATDTERGSGESASAAPATDRKKRAPGDVVRREIGGVLPEQRDYDPTPDGLKADREARENWEQKRHKRKKLEFGTTLTSTENEELKADPNAAPVIRKKRYIGDVSEAADVGHSWDEDGKSHGGKSGKLPMMVIVTALILIGGIALLGFGLLDEEAKPSLADTTKVQRAYGLEESKDVTEFDAEVSAVIKNFLEAKSVDELIGYMRQPERVGPLARQYYGIHTYEPSGYKELPTPQDLMSHMKYIVAVIHLNPEGNEIGAVEPQRIIALEQTPDGFKVDWESWVGYSEISCDLFTSQRMTDPYEFRAMVGRDDYYNFKYSDFIDWRCYQIRDPKEKYRLWGYTARDSEVDKALQRALLRSPYTFAVVRLRYPTGNPMDRDAKQVEIVELLEEGWVKRDDNDYNPDDEMLDGSFDFK